MIGNSIPVFFAPVLFHKNFYGSTTYLGGIPSVLLRKKSIWITKILAFRGRLMHQPCIIRSTWHVLKAFSSPQSFWEIGIGRNGAHKGWGTCPGPFSMSPTDPEFKPRKSGFNTALHWKVFLSNMTANESLVLFQV